MTDSTTTNGTPTVSSSSGLPPESIKFSEMEFEILAFWKKIDAFKNSVRLSEAAGRPRYTFYDGPPFATGLPHYGHILAGTIKDVVTRWWHQSGFVVERRFGWDCHGLPVEYEIDKTLGIKGPEDVQKMGVAAYNRECRNIVMRYRYILRYTFKSAPNFIFLLLLFFYFCVFCADCFD